MNLESFFPMLQGLKPTEQVVLLNLYKHKKDKDVFASQSQLISWTGIKSANTIKSAIKTLIAGNRVKLIKAGKQNSPAIYRLMIPDETQIESLDKAPMPSSKSRHDLNLDNRLRLAAIKKGLSPATWNEAKREASIIGITEEDYLIERYFGPDRLGE